MDKNNENPVKNGNAEENDDADENNDVEGIEDEGENYDAGGIENEQNDDAERIEDTDENDDVEGIEDEGENYDAGGIEDEQNDDAERIEDTDENDDKEGIEDEVENYDAEMLTIVKSDVTVPVEPGFSDDDDKDSSDVKLTRFRTERDLVWDAIIKYINHLSNEEITETRRLFCGCVNVIIDAYEEKLNEVQALKNKLKVWKKISRGQGKRIEELESEKKQLIEQLNSKVCEDCSEKRVTEQISSLSMQENTTKTSESASAIDGNPSEGKIEMNIRKRPYEDDENDTFLSDEEDSTNQIVYQCQFAACGLSALLNMVYKMKINFCPSKLTQMIGKVPHNKNLDCTHLLNNVRDKEGPFLTSIHKENVEEGKQVEALRKAETEFLNTQQKAGILSYTTDAYKHCVNIYKKSGGWKIYDVNNGKKFIQDLHRVSYLEVVVLVCDEEDGVPHISKRWSICHARHCKTEWKKLLSTGNIEVSFDQLSINGLGSTKK